MQIACSDCPCDTRDTRRLVCCMARWQDDPPMTRQQRRAADRERQKGESHVRQD